MKACLICAEFFGWGSQGGFGYATRVIGRELVKLGVEVYAVIPRPRSIEESEVELDGIRVIGINRNRPFSAKKVYQKIDADIYHSQQPSLASWVAQKAMPHKVHVATLRDPRSLKDWWQELTYPTHSPLQVLITCFYYENVLARRAIRAMDKLYSPANFLREKSISLYKLRQTPHLLPTPVMVPENVEKSKHPTVCFVGRWDRVKRPELFFDLASQFPKVKFLAIGKAHNLGYETRLRQRYGTIPNLRLVGYVDQFSSNDLSDYLSRSWILVNTSAKEALPNTFVEACAHRCAILSAQNPDNFASNFGRHVLHGDFKGSLGDLLKDDNWRKAGQKGFEYVMSINELSIAAKQHVSEYKLLLSEKGIAQE